jgi:hypothetical protein
VSRVRIPLRDKVTSKKNVRTSVIPTQVVVWRLLHYQLRGKRNPANSEATAKKSKLHSGVYNNTSSNLGYYAQPKEY